MSTLSMRNVQRSSSRIEQGVKDLGTQKPGACGTCMFLEIFVEVPSNEPSVHDHLSTLGWTYQDRQMFMDDLDYIEPCRVKSLSDPGETSSHSY